MRFSISLDTGTPGGNRKERQSRDGIAIDRRRKRRDRVTISSMPAGVQKRRDMRFSISLDTGTPFDNNPNLVVPIGDGFGFIVFIKQ